MLVGRWVFPFNDNVPNAILNQAGLSKNCVESGGYAHMSGMGNFVFGNLPNLIRQQRYDGYGVSRQRHEFHRAAFAAFVNEHNCAYVVPRQTMLRQISCQHDTIEFFYHVIHPMDKQWLM
jgi:hypothetical protein